MANVSVKCLSVREVLTLDHVHTEEGYPGSFTAGLGRYLIGATEGRSREGIRI